jgi:hypothetical protein
LAVIKNRLLQLTKHEFSVENYGARNINDLLSRFPSLIKIDGDEIIYLLDDQNSEIEFKRIRPDLWKILTNQESQENFVWDPLSKKPVAGSKDDALALPIVSQEELREWKSSFAAISGSDSLEAWLKTDNGSPKFLSQRAGTDWIIYFKNKISIKLFEWAKIHSIPLEQIFQAHDRPIISDLEELRHMVIACISVMNRDELSDLKISPLTIMRAKSNGKL